MIIKPKEVFIDLEFEVDKTYKTKFQTGELFTIKTIITRPFLDTTKVIRLEGIYENHKHLGLCPLDPERLIPEKRREFIEDETPYYSAKELYEAQVDERKRTISQVYELFDPMFKMNPNKENLVEIITQLKESYLGIDALRTKP